MKFDLPRNYTTKKPPHGRSDVPVVKLVYGGGSFGADICIVCLCNTNMALSRFCAIGPNPIVATIIPKIVPEIKLIMIKF